MNDVDLQRLLTVEDWRHLGFSANDLLDLAKAQQRRLATQKAQGDVREAFEKWWAAGCEGDEDLTRSVDGGYNRELENDAWNGFRAGFQAAQPHPRAVLTEEDRLLIEKWAALQNGPHVANMSNSSIKEGFANLLAIIDRLSGAQS
jgi:hypothetical protein